MQGSGESSLAFWTPFDTMTTANTRLLAYLLQISWTRVTGNISGFAVVGESVVGGTDIVGGSSSIITKPDLFDAFDESQYLLKFDYERKIKEPLGGFSMALGNIILDNSTKRFTPSVNATIGTALLPNRPFNCSIGFTLSGTDRKVFVVKGLTELPRENKARRQVSIRYFDYAKFLDEYPLETTIYQNQTSDQIIADILTTVGFGTSQYDLDTGLNTIAFAWFEKPMTAGERIKKICQAEEAHFYQDEKGILRFENRRHYNVAPHTTIQWTIDPDDVYSWDRDKSVEVINRCIVKAKPRSVKQTQEVFRYPVTEEIKSKETKIVWAQFDDPVTSFESLSGDDWDANSASDGSGSDDSGDVTVSVTTFTTAAKFTITNSLNRSTYITLLKLRGTPATVDYELEEVYQDDDSVGKFQEQQLVIENDFIDSRSFAYYFARAIVRRYKDPFDRIKITVQGIPQLQLMDKVKVKDQDTNAYKNYRVMGIVGKLDRGNYTQKLTLREITGLEADSWAIVGTSTVEGNDVVGI